MYAIINNLPLVFGSFFSKASSDHSVVHDALIFFFGFFGGFPLLKFDHECDDELFLLSNSSRVSLTVSKTFPVSRLNTAWREVVDAPPAIVSVESSLARLVETLESVVECEC